MQKIPNFTREIENNLSRDERSALNWWVEVVTPALSEFYDHSTRLELIAIMLSALSITNQVVDTMQCDSLYTEFINKLWNTQKNLRLWTEFDGINVSDKSAKYF